MYCRIIWNDISISIIIFFSFIPSLHQKSFPDFFVYKWGFGNEIFQDENGIEIEIGGVNKDGDGDGGNSLKIKR